MKILMVCLGNICRSPLAEGIMRHKIKEASLPWEVDSAGTSGWHKGELPDLRSIEVAKVNNIDITDQRSRQFVKADLEKFDLIVSMDASNQRNILKLAESTEEENKVKMLLNFSSPGENNQVPDPYYEGGFAAVFEMIDKACDSILAKYQMIKM